tara:strand:- start:3949 stop:4311 length:363 start_codon:yes stop_codon:yes gene_type:complete
MFFFTTCIAPVINVSLNKQNASKLLRRIFPKNFKFGLAVSVIAILISIFEKNLTSFFLSLVLFIFFLINLYYVMPKINDIADEDKKKNTYSKKFKKLHFLSVSVYLLQMILSILGIIICY